MSRCQPKSVVSDWELERERELELELGLWSRQGQRVLQTVRLGWAADCSSGTFFSFAHCCPGALGTHSTLTGCACALSACVCVSVCQCVCVCEWVLFVYLSVTTLSARVQCTPVAASLASLCPKRADSCAASSACRLPAAAPPPPTHHHLGVSKTTLGVPHGCSFMVAVRLIGFSGTGQLPFAWQLISSIVELHSLHAVPVPLPISPSPPLLSHHHLS